MSTPEQIQADVERTRAELSDDVNRLADKVSPQRVVSRRVSRVKSSALSVRERVMGSPQDGGGRHAAASTAESAKEKVGAATETVKESVSSAPEMVKAQAQGSPLAAGLVAFGAGMVISALLPASKAEQRLAAQAESVAKEHQEQLTEPLKQAGQQMAEQMKPAVQEATEQVKSTAQGAARDVSSEAKSSAQDVKGPMQQ